MPEALSVPQTEKPQHPFGEKVSQAIDALANELGTYPPAFTAIVAPVIDFAKRGVKHSGPVSFRDEQGRLYSYSGNFREAKAHVPIDAMFLKRGRNSLFLQISHAEGSTRDLVGEAELTTKTRTYLGEDALRMAHRVFPRFYPAPVAKAA